MIKTMVTLHDLAQPEISPEAKAVLMEAIEGMKKDQAELLRKAKEEGFNGKKESKESEDHSL